jgi:hypothetical protein
LFSIGLSAVDFDGGTLSYFADNLPNGAIFDASTHILNWTPGSSAAGTYDNVILGVNDGVNTVSRAFNLIVTPVDQPPTLIPVPDRTVREGDPVRIQLHAADPEGGILTFSSSSLPLNSFLDPNTGVFEWTPAFTAAGTYDVTFQVSDGVNQTQSTAKFIVLNANGAPVFDALGAFRTFENQPLSFRAFAFDPDNPNFVPQDRFGDQLTPLDGTSPTVNYSVQGLPAGATFDPITLMFNWTPGYDQSGSYTVRFIATDIGALSLTFRVSDDGNAGAGPVGQDSQIVHLVTRTSNQAPVLLPIGDQNLREGQVFTLTLTAVDPEGDPITYSASNLPSGASFDARTGVMQWTPGYFAAGDYAGIQFTASDGRSSSEAITLHVANVDRAPEFVPMTTQSGRESAEMVFNLLAGDIDQEPVVFSALSPLPTGAFFNRQTGQFKWTPGFDAAGEHTVRFGVTDPYGMSSTLDVRISIADTNRSPTLDVARYQVLLGQQLTFRLAGADPDADNTLTYAATGLPEGATLDAHTGQISWTPGAGQAGDYLLKASVSDGHTVVTEPIVIRATTTPELPSVLIEKTPSFPAVPGQDVLIHVIATGFADIASVTVTYNGTPLTLDSQGRAHVTAGQPGVGEIVAHATDAQGFVGTATSVLKVRDPNDLLTPVVAFGPDVDNRRITQSTDIIGTVSDSNLDSWTLEIAELGTRNFTTVATGASTIANGRIVTLDPTVLTNGFYTLRLQAADFAGRTASAEAQIEISSQTKTARPCASRPI